MSLNGFSNINGLELDALDFVHNSDDEEKKRIHIDEETVNELISHDCFVKKTKTTKIHKCIHGLIYIELLLK